MALSLLNSVNDLQSQMAAAAPTTSATSADAAQVQNNPMAPPPAVPAPAPVPANPVGLIDSAAQAQKLAAATPAATGGTNQWTGIAQGPAAPPPPAATPAANPLVDPSMGSTTSSSGSVAQLGQPAQWNVTAPQTVESRLASIISAGSPIIDQARTRALEQMNGRGLLNSSLSTTAADSAAYAAALPIAQADAATEAKAASYNTDEANQFGIKNQDAINQKSIAQLNTDTQKQINQLQLDNQKLLQTNNQAATAFNQALVSMSNINMNDRMDSNAKTQAIAQIQRDLGTQMKVLSATSGLNLAQQLNFSGYNGFDANGNYVGFEANGDTSGVPGSAPTYVPAAAGAAGAASAPAGGGYGTYDPSGGGGGGA